MDISAIIIIVLSLSFLVFVHELGHFLVAKISNIYVKQFSIGLPPKIFGKTIGETEYAIGALPIGGYVKLFGEDELAEEDSTIPQERAFSNKPAWVKLLVLSGGVIMNFIVGVLLIMIVLAVAGQPVQKYAVSVDKAVEGGPAAEAGISEGTYILGYKDSGSETYQQPDDFEAFVSFINNHEAQPMQLQIAPSLDAMQGLDISEVTLTPIDFYGAGKGSLGIEIGWYLYTDFQPISLINVPGAALQESVRLVHMMVVGVKDLVVELTRGSVPEGVAGIVGITIVSQDILQQGIIPMLHFVAMISLNLMIVNLLPFPALDGGRIVFVLLELITGRSLEGTVQQWIHLVGFALLLLLMVVITYNDIVTFF